MSAPQIYANGTGGSGTTPLAATYPFYTTGVVWYVYSVTGVDGASPAGKDRQKPLATVAQAYTNAAAGDFICCLSGHAETVTSALTCNKASVTIIGEGTGTSRPKFLAGANVNIFDVTAQTNLYGLYFPQTVSFGVSSSRIRFSNASASSSTLRDCAFEFAERDNTNPQGISITAAVDRLSIRDTTFTVTSTTLSSRPDSALSSFSAAQADFEMDNVTFDGGAVGWNQNNAVNLLSFAQTRMRWFNMQLLNGANITGPPSGSTGFIQVSNSSGASRVAWLA